MDFKLHGNDKYFTGLNSKYENNIHSRNCKVYSEYV